MTTLALPLNRARIAELIPHADGMCLLDRVLVCDENTIECAAISHLSADNPLRHRGVLPIHAGIEYCAQAIAVHGRLGSASSNEDPPRRGYLAVILNTQWTADRLDNLTGELRIFATKQVALQQGVSYSFAIKHQGHSLLEGQTVVALE